MIPKKKTVEEVLSKKISKNLLTKINIKMNQKLVLGIIIPLLLGLVFCTAIPPVLSEEEYLIVRIMDADFPPSVGFHEEDSYNFTIFGTYVYLEYENPTSHDITGTYGCSPIPFPHLETNLENKSIELELVFIYEWPAGSLIITPGVHKKSFPFEMLILNYPEGKKTLPLGEYTLWFDFTNCSSVPVPVVTYRMFIDVTNTNITYHFEFTNRTEIYDVSTPTPTPTSTTTPSTTPTTTIIQSDMSIFIILVIPITSLTKKFRKKKN